MKQCYKYKKNDHYVRLRKLPNLRWNCCGDPSLWLMSAILRDDEFRLVAVLGALLYRLVDE